MEQDELQRGQSSVRKTCVQKVQTPGSEGMRSWALAVPWDVIGLRHSLEVSE